jgi:hypothetical protein
VAWFPRHVSRDPAGGFEAQFPKPERELLRALPGRLRDEILAPDADPAVHRLFPPAHREDPEIAETYRALVHDDLVAGRLGAIEVMESSIDADHLDEEQLLAWMGTINDLRLILGTRLGVTDDRQDEDLPVDDARAQAYALYHYLSQLVEEMVEALSEAPAG